MNTFFHKLTYHEALQRAAVYNWGCNFRCKGCSYLVLPPADLRPIPVEDIQAALKEISPKAVHFLGGEPTFNPDLVELLRFCREELNSKTVLGHTNGSDLPLPFLDAANVSFKAFDDELYLDYAGHPARTVLENFRKAFEEGVSLSAQFTLIPGYIGLDQLEKVALFLSSLSLEIPLHITSFIPVPGAPWRAPTGEEAKEAFEVARKFLRKVTCSWFRSVEDYMEKVRRDAGYASRRVL